MCQTHSSQSLMESSGTSFKEIESSIIFAESLKECTNTLVLNDANPDQIKVSGKIPQV